ncbi:MAG: hypothetical protein QM674_10405, partial [Burkholderiaceae bacterium]
MGKPGQAKPSLAAAERLLETSRYRAACTVFAALADIDADSVAVRVGWGRSLAGLGNHEEAATQLLAALDVDPASKTAYQALKESWPRLHQPDVTLATLRQRLQGVDMPAARAAWAGFLCDIDRTELVGCAVSCVT